MDIKFKNSSIFEKHKIKSNIKSQNIFLVQNRKYKKVIYNCSWK